MELKILKTYNKKYLANNFIRLFKPYIRTSIIFNQKPNRNLLLCVDS